jgi:hypothetical protein
VNVDPNSVYTAQARIGGTDAANNSGAASVVQAGAGKVKDLSAIEADKGTSYLETAGATNDAVRAGAGTIVVSVKATDDSSPAKPVAGAVVTFTIDEVTAGNVDAGATVTAGGKTLSGAPAAEQKITVDVTTDADGVAELSIAYAGIKNNNTFVVTPSAIGPTTAAQGGGSITFTGVDSAATAIVDVNNLGGSAGDNAVHATTVGGPVNVAYQLVDQFGQTPVGTFRARIETAAKGGAIVSTLPVSSGRANLAIADNSDAVGTGADSRYNAVVANVQKLGTDGTTWTTVLTNAATSTIQLVSALPAANRVTVADSEDSVVVGNENELSAAALATVDARLSLDSVALPTLPANNSVLSGLVYGATGAVQTGASVTLSSPSLMFVTNAGTAAAGHYSLGSTTIKTGSDGQWGDVKVLSTVAGKHTVTVTSGAASTTVDVVFGAAAGNAGDKVTITAPASVLPGSTLQVSAVVTDKFGNPVYTVGGAGDAATVAITYTGPGLVVGTLPTETDKNGRVQLSVLMGSNDRGTFSVTVTYKKAANTPDADLIAATANVTVGSVAAVAGEARAWTRFLSATNELKIYARDVVNAGKIQFIVNGTEIAWIRATSAADPKLNVASDGMVRSVFVRDMLQGRNVIEIFEDGVRIERRIFTR